MKHPERKEKIKIYSLLWGFLDYIRKKKLKLTMGGWFGLSTYILVRGFTPDSSRSINRVCKLLFRSHCWIKSKTNGFIVLHLLFQYFVTTIGNMLCYFYLKYRNFSAPLLPQHCWHMQKNTYKHAEWLRIVCKCLLVVIWINIFMNILKTVIHIPIRNDGKSPWNDPHVFWALLSRRSLT